MSVIVTRDDCVNTEVALRKEWLETNGLGGYASSTIQCCHTRKYHGLLVANLDKPAGRYVLLSKVEASLLIDGASALDGEEVSCKKEIFLSTNKYPGIYYPAGHKYLEEFVQDLYPTFKYRIGDLILKQSIIMPIGENTVLIRYELEGETLTQKSPYLIKLRLRPLLAYRNINELTRENFSLQVKTYFEENGFKIQPYQDMPPLYLYTNRKSIFYPGPMWYYNLEYLKEERRGYAYQEDLFQPGLFEVPLQKGKPVILAVSTEPQLSKNLEKKRAKEERRRQLEFQQYRDDPEHLQLLKFLSAQFLIKNSRHEPSIIAGYHWFGEWGRDSMIALPGLTFYCKRTDLGLEILKTFCKYEKSGLFPNFISSAGECSYNSVDASLWFFWTLQEFLKIENDPEIVLEHFFQTMQNIISAHLTNQVPHCYLSEQGFILAGSEGTQLTWMDAMVYGRPVTPRFGAAVEVNALWYNALMFFIKLAKDFNYNLELVGLAEKVADSIANTFANAFWNNTDNCLADVLLPYGLDCSIRPNQIFAASLEYSPLLENQKQAVVESVKEHLLTPYGLRSLSPNDANYKPHYEGSPSERDSAYHQGTVWPWLVGHFGEAYLKVAKNKAERRHLMEAKKYLKETLSPLLNTFPEDFGISSIPEIFNGSHPHKPKGCIFQAWSLAEVIRLKVLLDRVE